MNGFEQLCFPDPDRKQYDVKKRIKKLLIEATLLGKTNTRNRLLKIQDKIQ